jgi:hypothetical protein
MKTNLILNLNVGLFNHQSMSMSIMVNGIEKIPSRFFDSVTASISLEIDLPAQVDIMLNGREYNDIEIANDGKILQEKFLHLTDIEIFDTKIETYRMTETVLTFENSHQQKQTPAFYWNNNGKVSLKFDHEDPLIWLFHHPELW